MALTSKNLQLGKGELWFNPFSAGTQTATGFEWLGNCPAFTLNANVEKLDHYNSTGGIKQKDESVTITKDVMATISCDDVRPENVARFIGADLSSKSDAGSTGLTTIITSTVKGRRYQLGESVSNPTGDRQVTVTTVADSVPTTYTVDTDYIVYPELGMIEIVATGSIADDTTLTVTYDTAANSRTVFVSSDDDIEGQLKFIADNPVGQNIDYFMPWVKMTPNGEFSLITDEWSTLPFNVECLRIGTKAVLYGDGRAVLP